MTDGERAEIEAVRALVEARDDYKEGAATFANARMTSMQAVTFSEFGAPDVLQATQVERPQPGAR